MKPKRLIVVLGMHRSGTSVITRALQVLGVELGNNLMAPIENNNSKGFFEDNDLVALNEKILNELQNEWFCTKSIAQTDVEYLHHCGYFDQAVEFMLNKVGSHPIFGIKDPRVAKLLPFWRDVFEHCQFEVSYILAIRNPLSVTKSLEKRDGLGLIQSYLLWYEYVISSLAFSDRCRRILVDYDLFMESPSDEINRISKDLGLAIDHDNLQLFLNEFLETELRHTVYDANDLHRDPHCDQLIFETYSELLQVASSHSGLENLKNKNTVQRWSEEFSKLNLLRQLIDDQFKKNMVLVNKMAQIEQVSNIQKDQLNKFAQTVKENELKIVEFRKRISENEFQISEHARQTAAFRNSDAYKVILMLQFVKKILNKIWLYLYSPVKSL